MVNGDGWYRPNNGMSYVQRDTKHVDAFLVLCTLSGLTTSTKLYQYKTPKSNKNPNGGTLEVLITNIYVKPKKYCKSEQIDFHGGRATPGGRREQKSNTPTQYYRGTIWCPQTEYGTFICRRNGYIYVTGNTYNDDMQAYAMLMLVRTWNSFDPKKSQNPFAFFTQCIKNSFIQYLNQEKRHRNIRDELLLDQGLNASFGFGGDGEDGDGEGRHQEQMSARPHLVEDEEDLESFEHEMEKLERNVGERDFIKVGDVVVPEEEVVITHPEDHEDEESKEVDDEEVDDESDNLEEK